MKVEEDCHAVVPPDVVPPDVVPDLQSVINSGLITNPVLLRVELQIFQIRYKVFHKKFTFVKIAIIILKLLLMKKTIFILIYFLCIPFYILAQETQEKIVLAYITSGNKVMPDPNYVTHVNYAFGTVKSTFDGVNVQNPERLKEIVKLKEQKPSLKILLSIGGWGAGGFSEMACEDNLRAAFVKDCKKIADEFNLDGIDMDWEYPSSRGPGITAQPEDIDNFTKLMKELREILGKDKLVTFATSARARYYDFSAVMPYCDFVNIMAYDLGRPPRHNASLYPSSMTRFSAKDAIDAHIEAGVAPNQLVLGVPFYGHGNRSKGFPDYVDYSAISKGDYDKYTHKWDEDGKVPYIVDEEGDMIVTYDSPESLKLKCDYALERGLLGVMYWEYSCDDPQLTLTKATYEAVNPKK